MISSNKQVQSPRARHRLSVILPAKNEASTVGVLVSSIGQVLPDAEIIVVDDGSSDQTGAIAAAAGALVVRHERSLGNGAAVKSGARRARGDILVFMDADGQHCPSDIPRLLDGLSDTCRLVVGARSRRQHASAARAVANWIYNELSSRLSGQRILDLTSGFRAAHAESFLQFLPLLPNGFSYPTTSTMAFLRAGFTVSYVPVSLRNRVNKADSHIRPLVDGGRFLLIIFRVATLYSPLKVFFPLSLFGFAASLAHSLFTFFSFGDFTTSTGALGFSTSALVFLIGLVSEQITTLMYMSSARSGCSSCSQQSPDQS